MIGMMATAAALATEPALEPVAVAVEASGAVQEAGECVNGVSAEDLRLLHDEVTTLRAEIAALRAERPKTPAAQPAPSGTVSGYGTQIVGPHEVVAEVTAFGDDVIVQGRVLGDATSFGGDVIVEDGGVVDGHATSFAGDVEVEHGGVVHGDRMTFAEEPQDAGFSVWTALDDLRHRAVLLLSFAGAGVLVVGLAPNRVARVAGSIEQHPFRSFLVGTAASGVLIAGSALFALTIVGLPVSLLLLAVLGLAWLVGFVGLCHAMGDRLPFSQKHYGRWAAFAIGCALVAFAGSLPWVGWIVMIGASLVGLGGSLRSRFGR